MLGKCKTHSCMYEFSSGDLHLLYIGRIGIYKKEYTKVLSDDKYDNFELPTLMFNFLCSVRIGCPKLSYVTYIFYEIA